MDYKHFQKILKYDNVKYDYDLIYNFFKSVDLYNKWVFRRIEKKTRFFDLDDYLYNPQIGCYYEKANNIIISYKLCLPYVDDMLTALMNVHEIIHALIINYRLGYRADDVILSELYPKIYEYLFILSFNDKELIDMYNCYLDELSKNCDDIHKNAIESSKNIIINDDYKQKVKKIVLNSK